MNDMQGTPSTSNVSEDMYESVRRDIQNASTEKQNMIYQYLLKSNIPVIYDDGKIFIDIFKLPSFAFTEISQIVIGSIEVARAISHPSYKRGEYRKTNGKGKGILLPYPHLASSQPVKHSPWISAGTKQSENGSGKSEKKVTLMLPGEGSSDEVNIISIGEPDNDADIDERQSRRGFLLHPTQKLIHRKLKDCLKKISRHKRVYVEKGYEQDIHDHDEEIYDEVQVDDEEVGNENDTELPSGEGDEDVQSVEDPSPLNVDEDDMSSKGGSTIGTKDTTTELGDDDEITDMENDERDTENDDADALTDYSTNDEGDTDIESEITQFEDASLNDSADIRLDFSKHDLQETLNFYRNILVSSQIPMGDCSNLGLEL